LRSCAPGWVPPPSSAAPSLSPHALHHDSLPTRTATWYPKAEPTFADAMATVRRALWIAGHSGTQATHPDPGLFLPDFLASLVETAYAAY